MQKAKNVCLSVAGLDSGAGAGISADLKTFSALGIHGVSVLTVVTAQNTQEVLSLFALSPKIVSDQLDAVLEDFSVSAGKIGVVYSRDIVLVLSKKLEEVSFPLVIDPVLYSSSGKALFEESALSCMRDKLFGLAAVLTPNLLELEILSDCTISQAKNPQEEQQKIRTGCIRLFEEFSVPILAKGGHRKENPCDLLFDGKNWTYFEGERVLNPNDHGTGCVFSSAIASYLARDNPLVESIRKAKDFLTESLRLAYPIGKGKGPVNPFWKYCGEFESKESENELETKLGNKLGNKF